MGAALCPCDGSLSVADYEPIVDLIVQGCATRSELLLDPLVERMEQLSSQLRYEEAAWTRDRHDALARSLQRKRSWAALVGLGLCEIETNDGAHLVLDHGRLVSTWAAGTTPPLRPVPDPGRPDRLDVPESVEAAEEADLIWQWMTGSQFSLVEATGTLSLPSRPVVRLSHRPSTT
jgi:hypothetical protein